jgi:anaerobic selenocysteine-containing dehydrogenase
LFLVLPNNHNKGATIMTDTPASPGTSTNTDANTGTNTSTTSRHHSYCRNCAANCGLTLDVAANRIVQINADPAHPLSQGYVCIKGTMAADLHNGGENRLTHCLQKGADGQFHAIDSGAAVDAIGARLQAILAAHGPRALATYWGTYSYFDCVGKTLLKSLMAELGAPAMFSSMTVDQSSKWVTAARMGVWANGKPVSTDTDVILVAGCNPPVSHQGYPMVRYPTTNISQHIRAARQRGARLIVIDPRHTELARRADLFIQPKPGYDAAIFAAMLHIVLARPARDAAFAARWTVNIGALRQAVAPFAPEPVSALAGIRSADLYQAVDWLLAARKPGLGTGTGVDMARFSNTAEHLFEALTALVGGLVRAGDQIPNPGMLFKRPLTETVYPPRRTWEQPPFCASDPHFGKLMGEFPSSLLPDEITCASPDRIRALLVIGGNPLMALGDPAHVAAAFDQLDLLVVIDPRADSATARKADFVIAPPLQFERAEVTSFTEFAFHTPFLQFSDAALTPPPQTLGEDEFAWRLAQKLGIDLTFKYLPFGVNYDEVPGGLPLDMNHWCGREPIIRWLLAEQGFDLEQLRASPQGITDSATVQLQAASSDSGARLDLCPADVAAEITDLWHALQQEQHLEQQQAQQQMPEPEPHFLLFTRRFTESYNSSFLDHPLTRRRWAVNPLHLHPDDMNRLGLSQNAGVRVHAAHGHTVAYVRADASLKPGCVALAHCWGKHDHSDPLARHGSHSGRLVSLRANLQSINRMPLQTGIPVWLEPLPISLNAAPGAP